MSRTSVILIYNLLLPLFFLVAFPAWLLKMWKRGGYGTGLLERFAIYRGGHDEPQGVVYVHAVSVGEVLIAQKLIDAWLHRCPQIRFVLAATTSTGHAVAKGKASERVRVVYSPLDFGFLVKAVFRRFRPSQVVLIESEAWPNLLNVARRQGISVSMVNARLSSRSESRFRKFSAFSEPLLAMVSRFCVQNSEDAERFHRLGIERSKIDLTGSIKFDPGGGELPTRRAAFAEMLESFGDGRAVVMAASTHAGEEKWLGQAMFGLREHVLFVVVPRHAERRAEVRADLEEVGYEVVLRSDFSAPGDAQRACLVVDSTGELRDWTAHADLMVIGKSWLGSGGQNPAEAIIAGVPVLCGEDMSNFEPLVTMLQQAGGLEVLPSAEALAGAVERLLEDAGAADEMAVKAREVLRVHEGAVEKTIQLLSE